MLTDKEKLVLRLLMAAFNKDHSINQIARECNLAPNGALKILRKFEKEGILKVKNIANIKSYRINFENEKASAILELALMPKLEGRVMYRLEDFKELKNTVKSCILFGSYTTLKNEPNDMDVLFILGKNNYRKYKEKLSELKDVVPVKIHDVVQTQEDLKKNIINQDKVILEILRTGIVLWGHKTIVEVIKDASQRQVE
ncbi:winged helix-turn-helix transcriptional regulator [Candidatus Woesearchaeota archaeon]|nr:winged helix-turn-helix transcriptional regulator [Candidatus Woesearchaeota archaeon]